MDRGLLITASVMLRGATTKWNSIPMASAQRNTFQSSVSIADSSFPKEPLSYADKRKRRSNRRAKSLIAYSDKYSSVVITFANMPFTAAMNEM